MILSKEDWYCKEELYTDWYKCRECKNTNITALFSHCPDCGEKIAWQEGEDK